VRERCGRGYVPAAEVDVSTWEDEDVAKLICLLGIAWVFAEVDGPAAVAVVDCDYDWWAGYFDCWDVDVHLGFCGTGSESGNFLEG